MEKILLLHTTPHVQACAGHDGPISLLVAEDRPIGHNTLVKDCEKTNLHSTDISVILCSRNKPADKDIFFLPQKNIIALEMHT